jgi:microcin C transport system permease protein
VLPSRVGRRWSPLTRRRLQNFRANRRGFWSLWLFSALFGLSLVAEVIANDRPLLVRYDGAFYVPIVRTYPETTFGGAFPTEAVYRDPAVGALIREKGWLLWPPIPFRYDTINYDLAVPAPAPPSRVNWLGTDDQGRDLTARLIYGFRISVLFGLTLTLLSSVIGVVAGAVQGYFGGLTDLLFQRFIEIWSGLPVLYLLIILASIVEPTFWWLLGLMLLFSWMSLVGVVRAEFLRARNFDYVRAARARRPEPRDHVPPRAPERVVAADLHAVHLRLHHDAHLARLPGLGRRPGRRLSARSWPRARRTSRRRGSASPASSSWP